jgi:hypothetical protein
MFRGIHMAPCRTRFRAARCFRASNLPVDTSRGSGDKSLGRHGLKKSSHVADPTSTLRSGRERGVRIREVEEIRAVPRLLGRLSACAANRSTILSVESTKILCLSALRPRFNAASHEADILQHVGRLAGIEHCQSSRSPHRRCTSVPV